jgi:hypothetical protein
MSRPAILLWGALICTAPGCHSDAGELFLRVDWQPLYSDPHRHPVDLHQTGAFEELDGRLQLLEVAPPQGLDVSRGLRSPDRSFRVFKVSDPHHRLLVQRHASEQLRELDAPSFLPERPYEALVWMDVAILVFDQRRTPHDSIHYVVDVAAEQLLQAAPFSP